MTPAFLKAANFVLQSEGQLSMDPDDPGNWTGGEQAIGELKGTKFGISAAQYPKLDIAGLRREDALSIYWNDFWLKYGADQLPERLALVYFDACVNQGPATAARALQRAVGTKADGIMGPETIAAARSQDQHNTIPDFLSERVYIYSGTKGFQKYGRGWIHRCFMACRESFL